MSRRTHCLLNPWLTGLLAGALALAAAGCVEERVVRQAWSDLPIDQGDVLAQDQQGGGGRSVSSQGRTRLWAIPLERFRGQERHAQATERVDELRRQGDMHDLWVEDSGGVATIYRGRFADGGSTDAEQTLAHTRRIEIDGSRPFADARVVPLGAGQGQAQEHDDNPHNLQQYQGYFSLQIAVYDDAYDRDRHEAAEQHVRELRDEGHEAYYYHGPFRSMVTVGLFREEEARVMADDPLSTHGTQVGTYSDQIRRLRQQFPYHYVNGELEVDNPDEQGMGDAGDQTEQEGPPPSFVIRVI